jgi:hypothetical protein
MLKILWVNLRFGIIQFVLQVNLIINGYLLRTSWNDCDCKVAFLPLFVSFTALGNPGRMVAFSALPFSHSMLPYTTDVASARSVVPPKSQRSYVNYLGLHVPTGKYVLSGMVSGGRRRGEAIVL